MKTLKVIVLLTLTTSAFAMSSHETMPTFPVETSALGINHFGEDCAANGDTFLRNGEEFEIVSTPAVETEEVSRQ